METICAFPPCRELVQSDHQNAVYHAYICRNRASRLHRNGEVSIECPRCGTREYVITAQDGDGCLRCGYADGDTLSLDGVRFYGPPYSRQASRPALVANAA